MTPFEKKWSAGRAWSFHTRNSFVSLKSPKYPKLFSERHSVGVRTIRLGFGWRITIRKKA